LLHTFQGWKNERVILEDPFTSSRIILIEPHDPKQHWKKVLEILIVVDRDLGLADMNISDYQNKNASICYLILIIFTVQTFMFYKIFPHYFSAYHRI